MKTRSRSYIHEIESRAAKIKPHLDLAVGVWPCGRVAVWACGFGPPQLSFNSLWLDLLDLHLPAPHSTSTNVLRGPYTDFPHAPKEDCVHSPNVLLRRWPEVEKFSFQPALQS